MMGENIALNMQNLLGTNK